MEQIEILTTNEQVAELAEQLAAETTIAVDLEADSMHNYQEKVCLIQVSTLQRTVLIDPLAATDLSPLKPILADPAIRKIFHAADYDLRSLSRDFDLEVNGLFDTMICAQLLGEERIGLADLLNKYFNVELDKKYQKADWSLRPLKPAMISYAAEDTHHLHRLAEILEQLWGYPPRRAADLRVVDVYVARLRGKLEPDPRNPELILTVRGTGYASQRVGEAASAPMAAAG